MKPSYLHLKVFVVSFLAACNPLNRGFDFIGEYEAPKSYYRVFIVAGGNIKGGHDISDQAFSLVRICPYGSGKGRSFDVTLVSSPDAWIKAGSEDLGVTPSEWNWRSAEGILKDMLGRAGFSNLDGIELQGTVRVIEGSLAGPKGTVLKGQIGSLHVLRTKSDYLAMTKSGQADRRWIRKLPLQPCEEGRAQQAAAPDASRR